MGKGGTGLHKAIREINLVYKGLREVWQAIEIRDVITHGTDTYIVHMYLYTAIVASFPGSLLKNGGGDGLLTPGGKVVDFHRLGLVVPIRLQNETTCTRDILSTQQKNCQLENKLVSIDYTSKVGEK